MKRKNKKRPKTFFIDFLAEDALFEHISQVDMLCEQMSKKLLEEIMSKGYKPLNKPKLQPYSDFDKEAPENSYRISMDAVYVGKKKAVEKTNEFKKSLYSNEE